MQDGPIITGPMMSKIFILREPPSVQDSSPVSAGALTSAVSAAAAPVTSASAAAGTSASAAIAADGTALTSIAAVSMTVTSFVHLVFLIDSPWQVNIF